MRPSKRVLVAAGVLALCLAGIIFVLNYERQRIDVVPNVMELEVLEYSAPKWDPFPHTVKITVETSTPVTIVTMFSGKTEKTESYDLESGEVLLTIYTEEKVVIKVENNLSSTGTVHTVLWCDSWNYAAFVWVVIGILLLIGSLKN